VEVTLQTLNGTPSVIVFTYAKCLYGCPMVTYYLKDLDKSLGCPDDLRFVHISVNPSDDTAEEVRKHFRKFGIDPVKDPRWLFLAGPSEENASVLKKNGIKIKKTPFAEGYLLEQTIQVLVLNRHGEIIEKFDTYLWESERMIDALQKALSSR
jgi:cytochrome oxidase Cu insertion factor (SCO1/SenC/PrrC family)